MYKPGVVYQDSPEDEPFVVCPKCPEKVYPWALERHMAKDHDPVDELAFEYDVDPEVLWALL